MTYPLLDAEAGGGSRPPLRFWAIRPTFYNFIDIPMGSSQMNWPPPLFHVAVHHTDVTVRDADILCRRVGILLGPFTDLDALNEQAKEFRGQLVDCPEALCLFDKGIYIRRRCFQLLLPLRSLSI